MKAPKPVYRKPTLRPVTAKDSGRQLMLEQWNQFAEKVLPPGVSEIQRREMRRAFYAGAESILFRVIMVLAPETEPTDEDLAIMEGLQEELKRFAKDVKEGRA